MNELAQHMVDTVKEWQCKIGVRKEKMDLFYPLESLKELLQLDPAASTEELEKTLTEFQKENESLFGKLHFWKEKERYGSSEALRRDRTRRLRRRAGSPQ